MIFAADSTAAASSGVSNLQVGALTALAALIGVVVTQWGARRTQQKQAEATADLDRERRNDDSLQAQANRAHQTAQTHAKHEHEAREEKAKRDHAVEQNLWKQRCTVYADFESTIDQMMLHGILANRTGDGAPTIAQVSATIKHLYEAEAMLILVAPKDTAKYAIIANQLVREIGGLNDAVAQKAKIERLKEWRRRFLVAARRDLEIGGDVLDFAYKKQDEEKATGNTNQ